MITIEIHELEELAVKLGEINANAALNKGIKKSIIFLEGEAKKETPVDKGFLRNSYETRFGDLYGRLINTREYGIYVHEGRKQTPGRYVPAIGKRLKASFVKGNPFLTRTMEKSEKKVTIIVNSEIQKMLESLEG